MDVVSSIFNQVVNPLVAGALEPISEGHIHSVSKETHHEFISFLCDPGSRSRYLDTVILISIIVITSIGKMKCTAKFIYLYSSPKETLNGAFFDWLYVYMLFKD